MKGQRFGQAARLRSNADFKAVIQRRARFSDSLLTVYVAGNGSDASRLGVSVGRASGGAVWRNRFKRLVREAWRKNIGRMPQGYDYVVMMTKKSRPDMPTYAQVEGSLVGLLDEFTTRSLPK